MLGRKFVLQIAGQPLLRPLFSQNLNFLINGIARPPHIKRGVVLFLDFFKGGASVIRGHQGFAGPARRAPERLRMAVEGLFGIGKDDKAVKKRGNFFAPFLYDVISSLF